MRYATTTITTVLFGFAGLATWLVWPLPDARFDWQVYADELVAEGECLAFAEFLRDLSPSDPEGIAAYLDERSLNERCPLSDDPKFVRFEESAPGIPGEIRENIDFMRRYPGYMSDPDRAMEIAFEFWAEGRQVRGNPFALTDLLLGFRCVRPIEFGPSSSWYAIRTGTSFSTTNPEPIPAWEARYAWCHQLAAQAADNLEDQAADADKDQELRERAERYRRLVERTGP